MKNLFTPLIFISFISFGVHAQENKPQLLTEPVNWAFERFALPPGFAPGIHYKGAEELRFAPGMFNKDSATYFTYAFVAQLDNVSAISKDDIRDYLLKYYTGLCNVTAKDRNLLIDTTQITAMVERKKGVPADETIYNASLNIFGVFADGAPVKLNMEVKIITNTTAKQTYLVFITSPREKTDAVWKKLYEIQKDFRMPN
jgi:hypothetical protein